MTKSKKHGIGLCKEKIVVDPTRHTLNTVSVYVDDANHFTNVDGLVDSHKYHWAPPHSVNVISLTDPTGGSTVSAAVVQIQAYCIGRKSGGFGDGDDDLIVTVYYDDPSGTETDECTFTEVEYDTSALETKAKNDRPR